MGRHARFMKQHQRLSQHRRQQREKIRDKVRAGRRSGTAAVGADAVTKLGAMKPHREYPNESDMQLLLGQAFQASRVPEASEALGMIIRATIPPGDDVNTSGATAAAATVNVIDTADDDEVGEQPAFTMARKPKHIVELAKNPDEMLLALYDEHFKGHVLELSLDRLGAHIIKDFVVACAALKKSDITSQVIDELLDDLTFDDEAAGAETEDKPQSPQSRKRGKKQQGENPPEDEEAAPAATAPRFAMMDMARHFIGRRAIWWAIEHGTKHQQKRVWKAVFEMDIAAAAFDRHASTSLTRFLKLVSWTRSTIVDALLPKIEELLNDPHAYPVAEAILQSCGAVVLLHTVMADESERKSGKVKKKKSKKEGKDRQPEEGQVASHIANLLGQKRGVRFLTAALRSCAEVCLPELGTNDEVQLGKIEDALTGITEALFNHQQHHHYDTGERTQPSGKTKKQTKERKEADSSNGLVAAARDPQLNFLVQELIKSAKYFPTVFSTIFGHLKKNLVDLCTHGIGTHVAKTLAKTATGSALDDLIRVLHPSLMTLIDNKYGSLAIRSLFASATSVSSEAQQQHGKKAPSKASSAVRKALDTFMEPHIDTLMFGEHGNLVVQSYVQSMVDTAERRHFFAKYVKPRFLDVCKHKYAAHVLHALLDVLDAQTHMEVAALVRPHILMMAQHVSARFIVAKLLGGHKDLRELLIQNLSSLLYEQGTHYIVLELYEKSDGRMRKKMAEQLLQNAFDMVNDKNASLILQKLIQFERDPAKVPSPSDRHVSIALTSVLKPRAQSLKQGFFSRFVCQLLGL